ncbi:hypothetical protein AB0H29_16570 [Streptomyces thermolilacinus]
MAALTVALDLPPERDLFLTHDALSEESIGETAEGFELFARDGDGSISTA